MAKRTLHKLSSRFVATATLAGRYSDGGNLYLLITPDGGKRWTFMYSRDGRQREMGLGPVRDVPLARAREKAADARSLLADGIDPLAVKRAAKPATKPTFGNFADDLVKSLEAGFRNEKHRSQWTMTLGDAYCATIRDRPVDTITTEHILGVLQPIWQTKNETASRIRGRIERVLDAAKAKGLREGENPARWRGHLDKLLPPRQKLARGHHAAMPFDDVPAFMSDLRNAAGVGALALEFTVLTAARTGEVIGARWEEIDLDGKVWTVPAARMKAGREHRVPLTDRAEEILREVAVSLDGPAREDLDLGIGVHVYLVLMNTWPTRGSLLSRLLNDVIVGGDRASAALDLSTNDHLSGYRLHLASHLAGSIDWPAPDNPGQLFRAVDAMRAEAVSLRKLMGEKRGLSRDAIVEMAAIQCVDIAKRLGANLRLPNKEEPERHTPILEFTSEFLALTASRGLELLNVASPEVRAAYFPAYERFITFERTAPSTLTDILSRCLRASSRMSSKGKVAKRRV